jgi:hypothetical protein
MSSVKMTKVHRGWLAMLWAGGVLLLVVAAGCGNDGRSVPQGEQTPLGGSTGEGKADGDAGDECDDPLREYLSTEASQCMAMLFHCEAPKIPFSDDCGCGCLNQPDPRPACDYSDPTVTYYGKTALECAAVDYACGAGEEMFDDFVTKGHPTAPQCGCGCRRLPCDYDDPMRRYLGQSTEQCATMRIGCPAGEKPFSDHCGCGCELNCEDPARRYIADDPQQCMVIRFTCEAEETPFSDACGCGCIAAPGPSCDYDDPMRRYLDKSPRQCALIDYSCNAGEKHFSDACGCGCELDCEDPAREYLYDDPNQCLAILFNCEAPKVPFTDACGCGCFVD